MDNPIKVLLVISNLCHGGAERQVVELANRSIHTSLEIHICSLSTYCPLKDFLKRPDRLHIIEKKRVYDIGIIPKLSRFISDNDFDIVHGFLFDAEIATRLAGLFSRKCVIVGSERNSNNSFSQLKSLIYRFSSPLMHACIANSQAGADFSQRKFHIPSKKYRIIRNGVDIERFRPHVSTLKKSDFGIPDDAKVIGMIASFKRQKNHPFLLEALSNLSIGKQDYRLLLVGSKIQEGNEPTDEYFATVQRLVDQLGLREKCILVESRNDIEELMAFCDVTVLPSMHEGTPNVAIESMASGVPVIATDISDNRHIIPHDKVGYIVALGDKKALSHYLKEILMKDDLRREMSIQARKWVVDNFSLDKMVTNFEDTYRSLLSS